MWQREFTREQAVLRGANRKFLTSRIVPHMEAWREAGIVRSFNAGAPAAVAAARARLVASEQQVTLADPGERPHGGHGYMDEYPISRQYTDARISTIYAGSSGMMKIITSRDCLGENDVPLNTRNF
jgi:alkylation response protein AidB-like acyl-CoA dehydrogenase